MKPGYWRERWLAVIRGVVSENPGASPDELRKIVSKAYPLSKRTCWPYTAWLKAVDEVLGPSPRKLRVADQVVISLALSQRDQHELPLEVNPE